MIPWRPKRWHSIVAVLCAIAVWWLVMWIAIDTSFIPATADICKKNEYTNQKECTTYHIALVAIWHVGEFLNYYAAAIAALATIALGIFTFTLWRATNGMLQSSRISERAYVLAGPGGGDGPDGRRMITNQTPDWQPSEMMIRLQLKNHGKTPASIERMCWCVRPLGGLPLEPVYEDWQPGGMGLSQDELFPTRVYKTYSFLWTEPYVAYGRVEYRDVFNELHYSGFLLHIVKIDYENDFRHPPLRGDYEKYWDKN